MSTYLSALIPGTVVAWYNLADVTAAGDATTVTDVSGNGRNLTVSASKPTYVLNGIGTKPVVRFSGSDNPLAYTPASGFVTISDFVLLAKYAPASGSVFADYNGLVSNTGVSPYTGVPDPVLIGNSGTANFYDYDPPAPADNEYRLDWVYKAETAMTAPVNTFGVIQYSITAGTTYTTSYGLQIGRDRDFSARKWKGDVAEMMFFSSVLTANERRRVKLYFDLKFGRYKTDGTKLEFPDPTLTGISWSRFLSLPNAWDTVTAEHVYEDDGRSFSTTTDTPPKRWEVQFTGLTQDEADMFDAFADEARRSRSFDFTDKWGIKHSGVRVTDYDRSHDGHRSWVHSVAFKLAKYY